MYRINVAEDKHELLFCPSKTNFAISIPFLPTSYSLKLIQKHLKNKKKRISKVGSIHHSIETSCLLPLNWRNILIPILFDLSRIEIDIVDHFYFLETLFSLGLSDTALFSFSLLSFWSFLSAQLYELIVFYKVTRQWCSSKF